MASSGWPCGGSQALDGGGEVGGDWIAGGEIQRVGGRGEDDHDPMARDTINGSEWR